MEDDAERNKVLLNAAKSGDTDGVVNSLADGADIHYTDHYGMTAIHWASIVGHAKIVKKLFDMGANKHLRDAQGNTPLHLAVLKLTHEQIRAYLDESTHMERERARLFQEFKHEQ